MKCKLSDNSKDKKQHPDQVDMTSAPTVSILRKHLTVKVWKRDISVMKQLSPPNDGPKRLDYIEQFLNNSGDWRQNDEVLVINAFMSSLSTSELRLMRQYVSFWIKLRVIARLWQEHRDNWQQAFRSFHEKASFLDKVDKKVEALIVTKGKRSNSRKGRSEPIQEMLRKFVETNQIQLAPRPWMRTISPCDFFTMKEMAVWQNLACWSDRFRFGRDAVVSTYFRPGPAYWWYKASTQERRSWVPFDEERLAESEWAYNCIVGRTSGIRRSLGVPAGVEEFLVYNSGANNLWIGKVGEMMKPWVDTLSRDKKRLWIQIVDKDKSHLIIPTEDRVSQQQRKEMQEEPEDEALEEEELDRPDIVWTEDEDDWESDEGALTGDELQRSDGSLDEAEGNVAVGEEEDEEEELLQLTDTE